MFKPIFSFGTRFLSCTRWNLFSILNSLEIVFYLEFIPALNSILVWNRFFSPFGTKVCNCTWREKHMTCIVFRLNTWSWLLDYDMLVDYELWLDRGLLICKWTFGKEWTSWFVHGWTQPKYVCLVLLGPSSWVEVRQAGIGLRLYDLAWVNSCYRYIMILPPFVLDAMAEVVDLWCVVFWDRW